MKKYINTSNYYLSTTTSTIPSVIDNKNEWHFDVSDITVDGVTLPLKGYYWVDVDFGDVSKREIFRVYKREGYRLFFDDRISPSGAVAHASGASVGLRDFSQLLNSLSTNTDNFGEVEKLGDLEILVRGGVVYHTSNMNAKDGKILLNDKTFDSSDISTNSELYIVLEYDELSGWDFVVKTELLLNEEGQYPIAKIVTGATNISEITDLRATIIGQGNMRKEVYDPHPELHPQGFDAFNMDNMVQGESQLFVTPEQVALWNSYEQSKQDTLISGVNIKTINGQTLLAPGNIPLDTILTVGWETVPTSDGATTFVFGVDSEHLPLTESSFIVFTDSGTMMVEGTGVDDDYTYDDATYTITFNNPLASTEHAYIWIMYNDTTATSSIGDGRITLTSGGTTLGSFTVNQNDPSTIDIGTAANNPTITFSQGGRDDQSITLNQTGDETIHLQGVIPMTQEEYDEEPSSKLTDGNRYMIYEN